MKVRKTDKKREHVYQIAATLVLVASLGFTGVYFQQRNKGENEQSVVEEKEPTESVSKEIEPQVSKEKETPADEPVQEPAQEPAEETATEVLHFNGDLKWPLQGDILIQYSMDHTVYFPTLQQYQYSPAVVIAGNVNDKVTSAASGMVTSIATNAKTGCTVTVDLGDGYQAVYGQLKEVPLSEGDTISAGDIIGYVSEPTKYYSVEGSNLYFQLIKDGATMNPLEFFAE